MLLISAFRLLLKLTSTVSVEPERAGREGTAITILEPRESRLLKNIERLTKRKITLLSVPTATDVHAKRLDLTRSSIHEILVNESDLGKYRSVVENLADEFDILDVAAQP